MKYAGTYPSVLCGLRVRTVLFSLLRTVRQAPWSRGGSGGDLLTANGPFAAPDRRAATSERQAAYCSHLQGSGPNGAGEEGGRQGRDHQRGNGGPGDQHVNSPRCGAYSSIIGSDGLAVTFQMQTSFIYMSMHVHKDVHKDECACRIGRVSLLQPICQCHYIILTL